MLQHLLTQRPSYPTRPQTYIHRSGRTGRAGSTGISITLVDRKKEGLIPYIQVSIWPAAPLACWVLRQLEGCCCISRQRFVSSAC